MLDSSGFVIKNILDEDLQYDNIVTDSGDSGTYHKHLKYLNPQWKEGFPSTCFIFREKDVSYDSGGRPDRSCITEIILNAGVYFNRNGYFDPSGITWRGKLANQRIADLLPLEF